MALQKKLAIISLSIALLMSMRMSYAQDGISVERGEWKHAYIDKIAVEKDWFEANDFLADHDLTSYWELDLADLHGSKNNGIEGRTQNVTEIGFTPVIRWSQTKTDSIFFQKTEGFFAEIGIGPNHMASRFNNNGRVMGSCFQFGDHVGVGYKFENGAELTLKFQHYSNAGMAEPNPAINFATLKFGYMF